MIFYALDNKTKCYPHMKQLLKYRMRDDEKQLLKFVAILRNMEWNFKPPGTDKDNSFKYSDKMDLVWTFWLIMTWRQES